MVSNPRLYFTLDKLYYSDFTIYVRIGIVLYMNGVEDIVDYINMIMQRNLISFNLDANVKWIIVTPFPHIEDYFLELWYLGVKNFVVLVDYSNQYYNYQILYNSDPQEISNNCGKNLNSVTEQICDSDDITIEFPKLLRKYTNCVFGYFSTYDLESETQLGYVVTDFVLKFITQHLNSSFTQNEKNYELVDYFVHSGFLRFVTSSNPSAVFFSPKVIWAVPKPKQIPLIEVLKVIFKKTVWVSIGFSFTIVSIIWWLIAKYRSNGIDDRYNFTLVLLSVWESTILGCTKRVPVLWSLRFIFISYILYSIHIQAIINSKIVEILTIPQYDASIRNLAELSESNLQIITFKETRRMQDIVCQRRLWCLKRVRGTIHPVSLLQYIAAVIVCMHFLVSCDILSRNGTRRMCAFISPIKKFFEIMKLSGRIFARENP
ncbi:hypothetical protein FQR65_LT02845 [Abscondita terminalis]|nr:hypothetical protein FQR65_LT02845 [Abscondita terminalis]